MRHVNTSLLLLLLVCLAMGVSGCGTRGPALPGRAEVTDFQSFTPPTVEEFSLQNGIRVLYVHDDEVPLVQGVLFIPGGSMWEDAKEFGGVSAMGALMREGGTEQLSADALDLELQKLSASIGTGFGAEYGTISFQSLEGDFARVFEIFSDVIRAPRFEEERLELWKRQSLEALRRRRDDPSTVAAVTSSQLVFGADTPFGRVMTSPVVQRIKRLDLLRAHRKYVRPNDALLVITGSVPRTQVERAVRARLESWAPRITPLASAPSFTFRPTPGIYFVPLSFEQATISLAEPGPVRDDPNQFIFSVLNEVFGSGFFNSRLMLKIRTEMGLAYWISGGIHTGAVVGDISVQAQTKAASAGAALDETLRQIKILQTTSPTEEEVALAKRALLNSFVFRFDSSQEIAQRRALIALLGYPEDFDQRYLESIPKISPSDIQRIANSYFDPSHMVVVIVGDKRAQEAVLKFREQGEAVLRELPVFEVDFGEEVQGVHPLHATASEHLSGERHR